MALDARAAPQALPGSPLFARPGFRGTRWRMRCAYPPYELERRFVSIEVGSPLRLRAGVRGTRWRMRCAYPPYNRE